MSGVRHEVIELLMDAAIRNDLSSHPWRNLVHANGRLFTPAEIELANTATLAEAETALRLASASVDYYSRKGKDLTRAVNLLATVPGVEDMDFATAASCLPPEQREELRALAALHPEVADAFLEEMGDG